MTLRRLLPVSCGAILVLTVIGRVGHATWWPWEPVRVCVALLAAAAVLSSSRRVAILLVCAWAFVASPLVVAQQDEGVHGVAPGQVLAKGAPSGPFAMNAKNVRVGLTQLSVAQHNDPLGETAGSTLVAWSITFVPWPHVDRTTVIGEGTRDFWGAPSLIETRRYGHDLLIVTGRRYDRLPEIRGLVWAPTRSAITIFGWLLIGLALATRLLRRRSTATALTATDAPGSRPLRPAALLLGALAATALAGGTAVAFKAAGLPGGYGRIITRPQPRRAPRPVPASLEPASPQQGRVAPRALHVTDPRIVSRLDGSAKAAARTLAQRVETCFPRWLDFTQCDTSAALHVRGLSYGTGAGQVAVSAAAVRTYVVTAVSASGNSFLVSRTAGGHVTHTCTLAGAGGCRRGGHW